MIHAPDIAFEVRNHTMNPGQHLDGIHANAYDHWFNVCDSWSSAPHSTQTIAPAHHLIIKAIPEHLGNLISIKMLELLHERKARSIVLGFHSNHHLRLPGCAPSSFFRLGCAEVGVIYLDEASEPVVGI
jgi:hypothetical protein